MQKNRKTLVLLLCLSAVFAVGTLWLRLSDKPPETIDAPSDEVLVLQLPTEQLQAVVWSEGDAAELRLQRDEDGRWMSPADGGVLLDQQKVERTVAALCQVVSNREVEAPSALAEYGLEPALRQVELILEDGSSVRFSLGSLNPYTNRYYFQMEGSADVHAVGYSVGESMLNDAIDYAPLPALPSMDSSFLDNVSLISAQQTLQIVQGEPDPLSGARVWQLRAQEALLAADGEQVEAAIALLPQLALERCITLVPTEQQLADWGLDAPAFTLETQYRPDLAATEDQNLRLLLYIGAQSEAEQVHVQLEQGGPVYLMPKEPLDTLLRLLEELQ